MSDRIKDHADLIFERDAARAERDAARADAERLATALRRVSWDDGSIGAYNLHEAGRCEPERCMYHAKTEVRAALTAHDALAAREVKR